MGKINIYYKELLIFDKNRKRARKIVFKKGINIITSKQNSVGKSSLSLMILHAFGAKVKFSDKWDVNNIFTKLTISKDDKDIVIVRYRDTYFIWAGEERFFYPVQKNGYSEKLYELLGLSIKIKDKNADSYSTAIPSLYLLPYYISQSKTEEERSVFQDLNMYNINDIRDAMYYHVGALDNKYSSTIQELTSARKMLDKLIKENEKQISEIEYLRTKINNNKNINVVEAEEELSSDIEVYEKYAEKNKERYTLLKESAGYRHSIKLLKQSLKDNIAYESRLLNEEEIHCPECHSDITEFITSALALGTAKAEITAEIAELNAKILENERKMALILPKIYQLKEMINQIDEQRENVKTDRANIVWNEELKRVLESNRKLQIEINKYQQDIKELSKTCRKYVPRKDKADITYRSSFTNILKETNVSLDGLDMKDIKLHGKFSLGGSEIPRIAISRFFALLESKDDNSISMPIIFDFPNLDMNEDNLKRCFKVMCDKIEDTSLYPQSFVFSIDCKERIEKAGAKELLKSAHIIDFEALPMDIENRPQLLCKHDYEEHLDEINQMIDLENVE